MTTTVTLTITVGPMTRTSTHADAGAAQISVEKFVNTGGYYIREFAGRHLLYEPTRGDEVNRGRRVGQYSITSATSAE